MTQLYGLNSCLYDNCDKKIIIKEKEGKRQGKKTHVRRVSNLGPLSQHYGFTTWPRGLGLSHLELACSAGVFFGRANFFLAKAHVETRKEGRKWGESKGAG